MLKLRKTIKTIISDKKKLALLISVLIIIIGVIPLIFLIYTPDLENPYKIESISLTSEDGTKLHAFKYTPIGVTSSYGVVVGHGFCGNAQHMQPMSIELVKRGFTVINLDFRGHGASEGYLDRFELINDVAAAVEYLENLGYISEIGLVGHSMGSGAVTSFARAYPNRVNATVAIGGIPSNMTNISNLLLAIGLFEQGYTEEDVLEGLRLYTGLDNVEIGVLYGDFNSGDATKGIISPFSEHTQEVKDSVIIHNTVLWFEEAFNGVMAIEFSIIPTIIEVFSYISLFGVVTFCFVIMVYLSKYLFKRNQVYPEKEILKDAGDISINKLIFYYAILVALIGFVFIIFLEDLFTGMIPLATSGQTFSIVFGSSIGTIIIYYFLIMRRKENLSIKEFPLKIKEMSSTNSRLSIIFGILAALLLILAIAGIWHWSVQYTLPSYIEIGTIMGMTLIYFPFFLIKEFYFRNVQGKLKTTNKIKEYFSMVGIGIFMDSFLIGIIMLISWLHLASVPISALYLYVWVRFLIYLQFASTWVYMWSGRNILGSTIFLCIFYSWMSVIFYPFGFL
ncbi:MAG: alpha/beta fold hydrolase [Candidatus Lokiarchaeia archaeon]